jgi:SOS-response transcriptional repressor LexA
MPSAVIPIDSKPRLMHRAIWSLLEVARPGCPPVPFGILLAEEEGGPPAMRLRDLSCFDELDEEQVDILDYLPGDLAAKGLELGGVGLIESLEDSLSHFFRISDRTSIAYSGGAQAAADRLFDEHVDATPRRFITHLPLYSLRAAATKFGESIDADGLGSEEAWVRVPGKMRLDEGMFVARVVGRSMEPRIPDGSLCVFRAPVVGSRQGKLLLIEMFDVDDASQRYTVKKYARRAELRSQLAEGAEREDSIRLEPLNKEFEAFDLTSDQYRVVAEFVQVLPS